MSAVNVVIRGGTVHFLTDGAAAFAGRFWWPVSKSFPLPHLNAIVAGRGKAKTIKGLADWIQSSYRSFDELYAGIYRGDLRRAYRWRKLLRPRRYGFQLVVGGISEKTGEAKAFLFLTGKAGPHPTWQLIDIPWFFISPDDGDLQESFVADMSASLGMAFINLIDRQREHSLGNMVVGGFGQVTSIATHEDGNRITTRIIRRWDEARGKPIDPELPPMESDVRSRGLA